MVERCSNGVAFLVLEPEPSIRTGIRVDIFEGDDPSTIIARLPLTWGRKWTDPLKGTGSGEFWIHALDETLAANPGILDYGNIARFSLDEVYRFAIQIEKLDRVQVKAGGDVERTIKVSGRGVLSKLEEVVAYPAGGLAGDPVREFTDATPGEILGTLFDEAQARGALTGLTRSFTDALDSNNAPHEATLTLSERAGTSLLRTADRLAELASDVYMTPNGDLKLVNARGIDRSQQLANAGPVILQPADNLTELTRSESGSIRNVLLIETPAGFLERSRGASVSTHGHREAFLSLGNISDGDAVDRASEAVFAKSADPAAEIGAAVLDKEGARPYVDWKPGDWVLAPNDNDELERLRVRALTVSETAEGQPIFTPDLATITEELEQRLERWLAAMSKGTVGGTAGEVAEPVQAPTEVVEAIDGGIGDHTALQPHHDELADLSDTDVAGLSDDDVLRYNAATGAWEPEDLHLDALDDVDLSTAPTNGQVLEYDDTSGLWKPATPSGGGGGGGGEAVEDLAADGHSDRGSPAFVREFTDAETEDSTTVEDTSPNITKTKGHGKLSIFHPGGDASAEYHGIVWPYTPAGDFYIEGAVRMLAQSGNHSIAVLMAADGDTYGAGTQISAGINASNGTFDIRSSNNWNSHVAGSAINLTPHRGAAIVYLRMAYTAASDLWETYASPDGVSWIAGPTQTRANPVTTHVGVAHSSWGGNVKHVASWEYVAVYDGLP